MLQPGQKSPKFLKIGVVAFCLMCLFFAINMASKYEQQKTETEIHRAKAAELEEKLRELSALNQELLHIRAALSQEKDQLAREVSTLRGQHAGADDWKLTSKNETSPALQSDTTAPDRKPEEAQETSSP